MGAWKLAGDMVAAEGGSPRAINSCRDSVRREPSLSPPLDDIADSWAADRPSPETPIEALHFVALDCETTGQSPHHLVELGAVAFTLRDHLMSFETLVHSNDRINPYARRIHGIDAASLNGAPPVSLVVERFQRFAKGAVLVEHSADAFDTRLISRAIGSSLDADNLDTTRLAAKLFDLRDTIGLERLCRELGVVHRRPHHALADAGGDRGLFHRVGAGAGVSASDGARSAICSWSGSHRRSHRMLCPTPPEARRKPWIRRLDLAGGVDRTPNTAYHPIEPTSSIPVIARRPGLIPVRVEDRTMPSHINRAEAIGTASAALGVLVAFLPWYGYPAGSAHVTVNAFRASLLGDLFFLAIAAAILLLLIGRGFVDDVVTSYIPESTAHAAAAALAMGSVLIQLIVARTTVAIPGDRHLSRTARRCRPLHRQRLPTPASRPSPDGS